MTFHELKLQAKCPLVHFGAVQPGSVYYSEHFLVLFIYKTFKLLTGHLLYVIKVFMKD